MGAYAAYVSCKVMSVTGH